MPEKPTKEKPAGNRFMRMMGSVLRSLSPSGWSDTEVRAELVDALKAKEPDFRYNGYPLDVYENEGILVYCMYDSNYEMKLYARSFKWNGDVAEIDDERIEVEATTVYIPVASTSEVMTAALMAASGLKLETKAASAAPCGCSKTPITVAETKPSTEEGDPPMTREARIAALMAAHPGKYTDADKTWLTAVPDAHFATLEGAPKEEPKPNDGKTEKIPTEPKQPDPDKVLETEEQFLARNPALGGLVARAKAAEASRRTELVSRLVTAQKEYSKEELEALPMEQLERTARMCSVHIVAAAAPDYSGLPVPRAAEGDDAAPPAPDFNKAVRAASGKAS